jgi:hypothetical protein
MTDLSSHVSSVKLSGLNVMLKLTTFSFKVGILVTKSDTFVMKTGSFACSLVEQVSSAVSFISQFTSKSGLISK